MAFLSVAPSSKMKTASELPPSACPEQLTPRPYVFMPPSKTPVISLGAEKVSVPLPAGMGREARFLTCEKFKGDGFAGLAETVTAKAKIEATRVAFILLVGVVEVERLIGSKEWL